MTPGDRVRVPVEGRRRPPLQGVVVDVHGAGDHHDRVIVMRVDGDGLVCVVPGAEIEVLMAEPVA